MKVLGLDTATPACQVAVAEVTTPTEVLPLAERTVVDARRAGESVAPSVEAVLADAGLQPADLDAVAVGLGPGPFTGLRVGIVTAAAFGDALGVPVYGVCSLDALASPRQGHGPFAVATDARRREVYWAVYAGGERVQGPAVGRPTDVAAELADLGVTVVGGDGALLYAAVFGELVDPSAPRYPSPVAVVRLAAGRALAGSSSDPLTPLYLRRPDAAVPHPPKAVNA